MNTSKIVLKPDLPKLERLWRDIEEEEHPGEAGAGTRAVLGSEHSRAAFDYLATDSFWVFASEAGGRFVGYATAARIPKIDARVGYLHVDELHVLSGYRRQGHASRLLESAAALARDLKLEGVRLLVDAENAAARQLYRKLGLVERGLILCERRERASS